MAVDGIQKELVQLCNMVQPVVNVITEPVEYKERTLFVIWVASRNYRNRRIGDFLKEQHLTEGRSTGVPKIRQALRKNGSPEPVFETDERNSYFLAHIDIHPAFKDDTQGDTQDDTQGENLDMCIENQLRRNPQITTEELAKMSRKGIATIK